MDPERLRELIRQHDAFVERIDAEWKRADGVMFSLHRLGEETGGYEAIAKEERALLCRMTADYHDEVVMPLLDFVGDAIQVELMRFADRLYNDAQDLRCAWSCDYQEQRLLIDRALGARLTQLRPQKKTGNRQLHPDDLAVLRAVHALGAIPRSKKLVGASQIVGEAYGPQTTTEKMQALIKKVRKRAGAMVTRGWLSSSRGRDGGYRLAIEGVKVLHEEPERE